MGKLADWIDRVSRGLGTAVAWLCFAMVLLGAANAVARYLGRFVGVNLASNAYIEAQWYLFSVVFLLGAAVTLQRDAHVRVDVFYGRLSQRGRDWIDFVGAFVFLIPFCVFAIVVSWPAVRRANTTAAAATPGAPTSATATRASSCTPAAGRPAPTSRRPAPLL